jgi:hypothetical protein
VVCTHEYHDDWITRSRGRHNDKRRTSRNRRPRVRGGEWLGVLKGLAMAGGTAVFAAHVPATGAPTWRDRVVTFGAALAPWLLSAFMIGSAILHVRHDEFVAQLMQPWMPWRMFWTYFAAVALAAGGIGLLIPKTARLAALMTSLMIFLWFLLVHTPRMLVDPTGPNGWSEIGESQAFSAMAFLLATRAISGTTPARGRTGD